MTNIKHMSHETDLYKGTYKNSWIFPKSYTEAHDAQKEMAERVFLQDDSLKKGMKEIAYIAGVDISNNRFDPEKMVHAAVVVLSFPSLEIVEIKTASMRQEFPYIPGLLGFREVPALIQAFQQLTIRPDLIMVDGHGISHPRGLGIASHLGVLLDIPTIGVAKSILVGEPASMLCEEAGRTIPLLWKEKEIGTLLRSKKKCSPLIISAGHKITLKAATEWVGHCLKGYRLPEPTRQAHLMANDCRKKFTELLV